MAESSLTGFIVKQAFKSRKEAKAEKARQDKAIEGGKKVDDKDRKGLFRKAFTKNLFGGLFGGRSATGGGSATATGAMLGGGKKKKQKQSKGGGKSSGGKAKGLEKILLTGFGSLAADTTAISGGLAALTEIMNSQLNVEGDMSSNIQGINAILADQLEVQTAFLDAIGGGNRSNDTGASNTGISSAGPATKSPDSGSFIQSLLDRGRDITAGAALGELIKRPKLLLNPYVAAAAIATIGGIVKISESERMRSSVEQIENENNQTLESKDAPWYQKLGAYFAQQSLNSPTGPKNPTGVPVPGASYSQGAVILPQNNIMKHSEGTLNLSNKIFNAAQTSKMSSGGNMLSNFISLSMGGMTPSAIPQSSTAYPMAAGGSKAMIGEAGKEAVVPLHSADSPAKSKVGMDPSMQASAGSMLAVTDQFIKSMGALGGPVSQALGADISNLAKTFGMSQTLPNLSLGGGKFREDTSAKKGREKFVKDLIAGSLEALGGKKKQESVGGTTPPKPPDPTPPPANPDKSNPAASTLGPGAGPGSPAPSSAAPPAGPGANGAAKPMDGEYKTSSFAPTQGVIGKGGADQVTIENIPGYPQNYVLLNKNDGKFEIWKRRSFGAVPLPPEKDNTVSYAKNEKGVYKDPKMRASYNEVRAHILNTGDSTLQNQAVGWGYLTKDDIKKWNTKQSSARVNGNQETGGTTIKSFQGGGGLDWLWKWLTTPMGQGASKPAVRGLQNSASSGQMGGLSKSLSDKRRMYEELGIAKPYEKGGTTVSSFKSAPAPKVSAASYTPMATADTESTDIGAIVNIVGSQAQQSIPVMPNNEGQTTSDYVGAPMGGGLAFTVLSTSQWGG